MERLVASEKTLNNTSIGSNIFRLFFSILYGLILASIPNENFYDYSNYIDYTNNAPITFALALLEGKLYLLSNEPLWLLINIFLSVLDDPETVVRLIIFFSASTLSWHIFSYRKIKNLLWIILILTLPQVLKNNLIHLRQGLAISIFYFGWNSRTEFRKILFFILASLVHSTFFFLAFLYGISRMLKKIKVSLIFKAIIWIFTSVTVILMIGFVSSFFGARQAEKFYEISKIGSGIGFFMWLCFLFVFLANKRDYVEKYSFEIGVIIFYLTTYPFGEVFSRVFDSGISLILIASLSMNNAPKKIFNVMFILFWVFSWMLRFNKPLLGFGP